MNKRLSPSDRAALLRDAAKRLDAPTRRVFLLGAAGIGTLAAATGIAVVDGPSAENVLDQMSRFNDKVQAWLFDPVKLAPTFSEADITRPYPFNAFYPREEAPDYDDSYSLSFTGRVTDKRAWSLGALRAMRQESQITRHICIEGWSAIGKWSGIPLWHMLARVGADLRSKYVTFHCLDNYSTSIDMASALHRQTILALSFCDKPLPRIYGAPLRLRIPTKLGFKSAKHVFEISVNNDPPTGFWERTGYNWFSGS